MISFRELPIKEDILAILEPLKINYAFQPIFYANSKEVFAYEALMRPEEMNVEELIAKYESENNLHSLEVATFFGAVKAYIDRGYKELVSINSFPSEHFTDAENEAFAECFGEQIKNGIIEILEFPETSMSDWNHKKENIDSIGLLVALDDYGTGANHMKAVKTFQPNIIKIDRSLIENIDSEEAKQEGFDTCVTYFHEKGIKIVAEGVETKEEYDYVCTHGVDFVQGYYTGRPV